MSTKRLFSIPVAFSVLAAAATLTEADRKDGLAHLERTRAALVAATKGLSEAQWKFKPAPDRWSVAEVVEHIALAEDMMLDNAKKAMQSPAGKPDRDYKAIDKTLLSTIPDRSRKFQAPEPLV